MRVWSIEKLLFQGFARRFKMRRVMGFYRDERGVVTALALFTLIAMALIGGLALDVMNRTAKATRLDMTTDAVAHAAIHARMTMSEEDAIAVALAVAHSNMPPSRYGDVFLPQDIEFGTSTKNVFQPNPGALEAVRVRPRMIRERASAVPTFLLRLVDIDAWTLASVAHFRLDGEPCLNNGFVARTSLKFNANNTFESGICLHSNGSIWIRQNNTFEPGSSVSLPDLSNLDLPSGSTSGNVGLDDALSQASRDLSLLDDLSQAIAALEDPYSDGRPQYITSTHVETLNASDVSANSFKMGHIHRIDCAQNGGELTLPDTTIQNIVLVTDCSIRLSNGTAIEESIIATTSNASESIRGSSGARFGRDNGCLPGAGTQILTLGGMFFPANLSVYSAQLIATGTINFQANAGVSGYGAAFIADVIDGRTNMNASSCDAPMENHFGGSGRIRPFKGG